MIPIPETVLQRVTSVVLVLYVGAFIGQAFCVLHSSPMGAGMEGHSVAHASPSMAVSSSSKAMSPSAHSPSQHAEYSGGPGEIHSGMCAGVAWGSAIKTTADHGLGLMSRVSNTSAAYIGGMMPPDVEMVPPPPRLG